MRNLLIFVLGADFLIGSLSFGALYMSALPFLLKVFVGSLAILFAGILQFYAMEQSRKSTVQTQLVEIAIRALEGKLNGDTASIDEAQSAFIRNQAFDNSIDGYGTTEVLMLLGRFGSWLGGGALLASYVLPELFKKYL